MYAEGDDVVACFGCSHPLVDGSVQLFGRAPLAAFNGDAAQKGEIKEGGTKGGGGGPVKFFSHFVFAIYIFSCMKCYLLKASSCSGPNNTFDLSFTITQCFLIFRDKWCDI